MSPDVVGQLQACELTGIDVSTDRRFPAADLQASSRYGRTLQPVWLAETVRAYQFAPHLLHDPDCQSQRHQAATDLCSILQLAQETGLGPLTVAVHATPTGRLAWIPAPTLADGRIPVWSASQVRAAIAERDQHQNNRRWEPPTGTWTLDQICVELDVSKVTVWIWRTDTPSEMEPFPTPVGKSPAGALLFDISQVRGWHERNEKHRRRHQGTYAEQIRTLYVDEQLSSTQIAERVGISPVRVLHVLRTAGVPIRDRKQSAANRTRIRTDLIIELYESGMSAGEIANEVVCHINTVLRHLRAAKVPIRGQREARALAARRAVDSQMRTA